MTVIMLMHLYMWFFTKHFICDFPLQAHPYQYLNKGTYGHPGGILHSSIHGVGTFIVLCGFIPVFSLAMLGLVLFDMLAHYHIDLAKMKIGKKFNLKPDNSEFFWILLGADQFLHLITYWIIIINVINILK